MEKLIEIFRYGKFKKDELLIICKHLRLSPFGSKKELRENIIDFIKRDKHHNIKRIPNVSPDNLSPDTPIRRGFACDDITINFFKKYTNDKFEMNEHIIQYIKLNPHKKYQDVINFWNYMYKSKDKFSKKFIESDSFKINDVIEKFNKKNSSLNHVIKNWQRHKEINAEKCFIVGDQLIRFKRSLNAL